MFGQDNMVVFAVFLYLLTNSGSQIEAVQIGEVIHDLLQGTVHPKNTTE